MTHFVRKDKLVVETLPVVFVTGRICDTCDLLRGGMSVLWRHRSSKRSSESIYDMLKLVSLCVSFVCVMELMDLCNA